MFGWFFSLKDPSNITTEELVKLCRKVSSDTKPAPAEEKLIILVVHAVSQADDPNVQLEGVLALAVLAEHDGNKRMIVTKGAIAPLVRIPSHTNNDKMLYGVARCLLNLSTEETNRARLASEGGFQAITLLSSSLVSQTQHAAARVLLALSEDPEIVKIILTSSLPNTVAELLCSDTELVQLVAANIINLLASTSPSHDSFAQDRVLTRLMDLLRVGSEGSQYAACTAIRAIIHHAPNRVQLLSLGLMRFLVQFIKEATDRLKFVSMLTIVTLGVTHEVQDIFLQEDGLMDQVIRFLELKAPSASLTTAAARLIGTLIRQEKLRQLIMSKGGFRPFVNLLSSKTAENRAAATSVLNTMLREADLQKQFLSLGVLHEFLDTIADSGASIEKVMAMITVLFAVSNNPDCRRAIQQRAGVTDQLIGFAPHDMLAALILADLALGDPKLGAVNSVVFEPVVLFVKDNDYADKTHSNMLTWDKPAIKRLDKFATASQAPLRVLATWVYCHLASNPDNIDEMVAAKVGEVLVGLQDVARKDDLGELQFKLSSEGLRLFAASGPLAGDIGERFKQYQDLLSREMEPLEGVSGRYANVKSTISRLDKTRILAQSPYFASNPRLLPEVNTKLAAVREIREQILNGTALQEVNRMEAEIRDTMDMVDSLKKLKDHSEVVEKIRSLRKYLQDILKDIEKHKLSLDAAKIEKNRAEESASRIDRTIDEAKAKRQELEKRIMDIMTEMVEVQYLLSSNPTMREELTSKKRGLNEALSKAQSAIDSLNLEARTHEKKISEQHSAIKSFERKAEELKKAKASAEKVQRMKSDLQASYGADLYDNTDFVNLQSSMLLKVFDVLQGVKESQPQLDSRVDRAEGGDASAKDRAITSTIAAMQEEIRGRIAKANDIIKSAQDNVSRLAQQKTRLEEDVNKTQSELGQISRQTLLIMAPDELQHQKANLESELARLKAEVSSIDNRLLDLDKQRKPAQDQLMSASAKVAGEESAVRRFVTERNDARTQYDELSIKLSDKLDRFLADYNTFISKREAMLNKLSQLENALSQWLLLFREEESRRNAAEAVILSAYNDLRGILDALKQVREQPFYSQNNFK